MLEFSLEIKLFKKLVARLLVFSSLVPDCQDSPVIMSAFNVMAEHRSRSLFLLNVYLAEAPAHEEAYTAYTPLQLTHLQLSL